MSKLVEEFEREQMNREITAFNPGDTVVVRVKVKEGNRERLQAFEGVVIAKRNRGLNSAFTVRKISHGEGGGAGIPDLQSGDRRHHRQAPWRRAPRQAVLLARSGR